MQVAEIIRLPDTRVTRVRKLLQNPSRGEHSISFTLTSLKGTFLFIRRDFSFPEILKLSTDSSGYHRISDFLYTILLNNKQRRFLWYRNYSYIICLYWLKNEVFLLIPDSYSDFFWRSNMRTIYRKAFRCWLQTDL